MGVEDFERVMKAYAKAYAAFHREVGDVLRIDTERVENLKITAQLFDTAMRDPFFREFIIDTVLSMLEGGKQ